MAAYGALLSLSHLLHQILHPPPLFTNIITIDTQQIEFLQGKIEMLIGFLEAYPSRRSEEIADLEAWIRDAAYIAEDVIESNVMDQIHASDLYRRGENETSTLSFDKAQYLILSPEGIQRLIDNFLSIEIEKELLTIRIMQGMGDLRLQSLTATTSSGSPLPDGKITMVGFDEHLIRIMSQLAGEESSRQVIPIVGMGGIDTDKPTRSNAEPGLRLHKKLFGKRYLIVMDDMWDINAWEELKLFLPDNENGSRVLVTSRLSNLTVEFGSCAPYKMDFLDEAHSWDLFSRTIFSEEDCPVELEEIGKYIVKRCRGLPLAIVLVSGLLAKAGTTREHWEVFAGDMGSSLSSEINEQVQKILSLSYTHLPVRLKPCFLYLAVFTEDSNIRISTLVRLWVAEGLIKPTQDRCLEEIAHEYLEDLISRNLVLVCERGSMGNVKSCKLHDVVRDLCITQAEKEKFVWIAMLDSSSKKRNLDIRSIKTARRLSLSVTTKPLRRTTKVLQSASLNRTWLSPYKLRYNLKMIINGFRLLKVVHENDCSVLTRIEQLNLSQSNLRYVYSWSVHSAFSMVSCWNLQTLLLPGQDMLNLPSEIWSMPQLRHLKIYGFTLLDPPDDDQNVVVLQNLQTIKRVREFKCSEHVLRRIPNLKKLRTAYLSKTSGAYEKVGDFCLHNLSRLRKLKSLRVFGAEKLWPTIMLPISLKKLTLGGCWIPWKDFSILVGSLPNLEVLKLDWGATRGKEWHPIEGQFCRLKFLSIWCPGLEIWGAENYHFPCLERLYIKQVHLEKIPLSFSEILTLQLINLKYVRDSMRISAREISEERVELGYEPLLLQGDQVYFDRDSRWV